jgi:7-carboxy-7-deazaguanine synthase
MLVNEMFSSIEGEGIRQGYLCSFVRFYGCPLNCSYCDSRYACTGGDYREMNVQDIVSWLDEAGIRMVTLTGGEPMAQHDIGILVDELLGRQYKINIETSGHCDYTAVWDRDFRLKHFHDLFMTVDYKSPSSGMERMMCKNCFTGLMDWDVLKFVVGSVKDLDTMTDVIREYRPKCHIFASPVFGKISPAEIVDYLKSRRLESVRIQLQLHKYIWDPAVRGV